MPVGCGSASLTKLKSWLYLTVLGLEHPFHYPTVTFSEITASRATVLPCSMQLSIRMASKFSILENTEEIEIASIFSLLHLPFLVTIVSIFSIILHNVRMTYTAKCTYSGGWLMKSSVSFCICEIYLESRIELKLLICKDLASLHRLFSMRLEERTNELAYYKKKILEIIHSNVTCNMEHATEHAIVRSSRSSKCKIKYAIAYFNNQVAIFERQYAICNIRNAKDKRQNVTCKM